MTIWIQQVFWQRFWLYFDLMAAQFNYIPTYLQNNNVLDYFKKKAFADNKTNVAERFMGRTENV